MSVQFSLTSSNLPKLALSNINSLISFSEQSTITLVFYNTHWRIIIFITHLNMRYVVSHPHRLIDIKNRSKYQLMVSVFIVDKISRGFYFHRSSVCFCIWVIHQFVSTFRRRNICKLDIICIKTLWQCQVMWSNENLLLPHFTIILFMGYNYFIIRVWNIICCLSFLYKNICGHIMYPADVVLCLSKLWFPSNNVCFAAGSLWFCVGMIPATY